MTAQELIRQALLEARALGIGQTLEDEQAQDALTRLNSMVAFWAAEDLLIPYRTRETLTLTVATNPHTIGSGGTLNTTQPIDIHAATLRRSDTDYNLTSMQVDEYQDLASKTTSGMPTRYYFERGLTLGSIFFDYVPDSADSLILVSLKPVTGFAALTTEDSFPAEYDEPIMLNLAMKLCAGYGKEPKKETREGAITTLRTLKRNASASRMTVLKFPAELRPGRSPYNINSGE